MGTAVTILALALGIGANIGSFIAVNAIVLHPFPHPDLERILTVWATQPKAGWIAPELRPRISWTGGNRLNPSNCYRSTITGR
jgi:hypothetical protein